MMCGVEPNMEIQNQISFYFYFLGDDSHNNITPSHYIYIMISRSDAEPNKMFSFGDDGLSFETANTLKLAAQWREKWIDEITSTNNDRRGVGHRPWTNGRWRRMLDRQILLLHIC